MTRFHGRRAIVTGSASGIGLAVAKRIAAEGGKVALWDLSRERLEEARRDIKATHIEVVDISNWEAVAAATEQTVRALEGLDILVHCAGVLGPVTPIENLDIGKWRSVLSVNLDGSFYCCRSIVPHLKKNGYGRIVLLSSIAGKVGMPGGSAYCASKAAVMSLAKCLGKELANVNITVNAVTPGLIATPMLKDFPPERLEFARTQIPMERIGTMDEAAAMICFMSSEECSFSTGAVFDLSGGRADY
jgi:2-dehydro-3-deoxy-L-rhamnonate dehydrogenase (NAD+)